MVLSRPSSHDAEASRSAEERTERRAPGHCQHPGPGEDECRDDGRPLAPEAPLEPRRAVLVGAEESVCCSRSATRERRTCTSLALRFARASRPGHEAGLVRTPTTVLAEPCVCHGASLLR